MIETAISRCYMAAFPKFHKNDLFYDGLFQRIIIVKISMNKNKLELNF